MSPLPRRDPDPEVIGQAIEALGPDWEAVAPTIEGLEEDERRIALWLLVAERRVLDFFAGDNRIPGLRSFCFGVAGSGEEARLRVIAYVPPVDIPEWTEGSDDFSMVLYAGDEVGEREPIEVVSAPWALSLHSPMGLKYATVSCWMRWAGPTDLLLSVRHAIADDGFIDLDDGSAAPVVWVAPECLDVAAALAPSPQSLRPLPVLWPTALREVEAMTGTGPTPRRVHAIGRTFGTITAANPHLFLLDRPLVPGDSGSLIRVAGDGPALGIYLGSLASPEGPVGLCQGLLQIGRLAALEPMGFEDFYEEV